MVDIDKNEVVVPVIKQLEAYNKRNIDEFIINFSNDCLVEDGQGKKIMQGREAMYDSYKKMFESSPELHCHLASRIVVGNYVLDEERVTGRAGSSEESHVVAVYRIEDGQICHVRFLR